MTNKGTVITVDFTDYPKELDWLKKVALDDHRTPDLQIIRLIYEVMNNWHTNICERTE